MKNGSAKTALVAGGAGFIGSQLCDALIAEGASVLCLDSFLTGQAENIDHLKSEPRFDIVQGDVIDPALGGIGGQGLRFTHIYNLACAASPPQYQADPEHTMLTNVVGTSNLLRLAERHGARFLLTSTSEVYGDPEVHPQPESYRGSVSCIGPRACYDEGKRAAEALSFDFARAGRADVRVARLFNTYGPRMRPDDGRVISNIICQALAGEDITIYGDGSQTRSFCYVSDIVDGLMRLMDSEQAAPAPVNLGNPNELTVRTLVDLVIRVTGSQSGLAYRPLPVDDPRRRNPDISLAKATLGWEPRISLQEGLELTAAWLATQSAPGPGIGDEMAVVRQSLAAGAE